MAGEEEEVNVDVDGDQKMHSPGMLSVLSAFNLFLIEFQNSIFQALDPLARLGVSSKATLLSLAVMSLLFPALTKKCRLPFSSSLMTLFQ